MYRHRQEVRHAVILFHIGIDVIMTTSAVNIGICEDMEYLYMPWSRHQHNSMCQMSSFRRAGQYYLG